MNTQFIELNEDELEVNGSGFLTAVAGAYLGAHVGLVVGLVYTVATGDFKDVGKNCWNGTVAGAVTGGVAGAFVPAA